MQPGLTAYTVVVSSQAASLPTRFISPTRNSPNAQNAFSVLVLPGILVTLSAGASLTYNVEVTGDDLDQPGYNPASGTWAVFTGMGGLTASGTGSLGAAVTAVRLNVTSYSSGSATLQFVQVT